MSDEYVIDKEIEREKAKKEVARERTAMDELSELHEELRPHGIGVGDVLRSAAKHMFGISLPILRTTEEKKN